MHEIKMVLELLLYATQKLLSLHKFIVLELPWWKLTPLCLLFQMDSQIYKY
jgi:hypothetical protein